MAQNIFKGTPCFSLKSSMEKHLLKVAYSFRNCIHTQIGERFDERILNYIRSNPNFHKTTVNVTENRRLERNVKERFDYCFNRRKIEKTVNESFPVTNFTKLPYYILDLGQGKLDNDTLGMLSMCDFQISKVTELQLQSAEKNQREKFTCMKILDSWMYALDYYYLVSDLECYSNLIKQSTREILSLSFSVSSTILSENVSEIIHLAFVASLGKKGTFSSHEVLNQLALFCTENPGLTYKAWNDFEAAVMCSSFFRSGIKIQSKDFLHEISSRLSEILERHWVSEDNSGLDVSVVISLLKVLRQANFIEDGVLSGVRKLIMDKDKGEDILKSMTVLSHFMSAFSSSPNNRQMTLDSGLASVFNRAEHLVNTTLRFEEEAVTAAHSESQPQSSSGQKRMTKKNVREVHPSVKSRLKDISRWLWSAALLGCQQIRVEAYDADFNRRFSTGEFGEEVAAAVEALLALAIMNHYPDLIVTKVLHSLQFRSTLKVRCHRRQKVRFALFLTLVKIERNDLWRQLSPDDVSQLQAIVPPFRNGDEDWKSEYFDTRKEKFANHCQLLNECMESLNDAFHVKEIDFRKDYERKYENYIAGSHNEADYIDIDIHIRRGCAIPYVFIPGIKVDFLDSGKSLFIEVLDTESFSPGFLQMKLRILSQLGNVVLYVTPQEIKQCPNLGQFFKTMITKLLPD